MVVYCQVVQCEDMDRRFQNIFENDAVPQDFQALFEYLQHVINSNVAQISLERFRQISRFGKSPSPLRQVRLARQSKVYSFQFVNHHLDKYDSGHQQIQDFCGEQDTILLDNPDAYYMESKDAETYPYYSLTAPFVQSSSYPPEDHQVRDYLTLVDGSASDSNDKRDERTVMMRHLLFFSELFAHAVRILASDAFKQFMNGSAEKTLSAAWFAWFEYGSDSLEHGPNRTEFYVVVANARGKDAMHRAEVVIFFDEAHTLPALTVTGLKDPNSDAAQRPGLYAMERAFTYLRALPVFRIFMSTNSRCHPSSLSWHSYWKTLGKYEGMDLDSEDHSDLRRLQSVVDFACRELNPHPSLISEVS
ncbi:hypothetical protein DXG03_008818 [Asterophora parasitica]|uniref:Uncharacterized protein n=1 Tax=Asterophora parasitica TaxID=117018 RepID=A0A9P7G8P6_9AGAR|nr:hypothetical protein DXG03_008818 [Asterophora parasitica]